MKKKNNSIKLFYKLAKRTYLVSKKRELGWKWSDAQKWTSKNLFQAYKGTKNLSKVKVTEIDKQVADILDGNLPIPSTPIVTLPEPIDDCYSPFEVASYLLDSFEWFDINEKVSILNDDLQVDLDLELDNNVFAKTGVVKKSLLPDLIKVREDIRKLDKGSDYPLINFYIVLIEGREDNRDIACNYYVLITFDNSFSYKIASNKGLIRKAFITKEQTPITEQERIEIINKQKEEDRKLLNKNKAKSFKLPTKVEPETLKPEAGETSIKDTKANRTYEYNKAIEKLESLLERKLITKKQFSARFDELGKNLKDGGEI